MDEAVDAGLIGFRNVSGSNRGKGEKTSGLPLVSVLFPAPFAPAMSVKTGDVTVQEMTRRSEPGVRPSGSASPQGAGGPLPALLSHLLPAFGRIPANSVSYS